MLDTRLLKAFCALANHGSVVAAARELHLTASAVSHSLKQLEAHLGCRLFERAGKRIYLNHAGEQLLAQVAQPLAALTAAEDSIRQLARWGESRLRVGASASACEYILPGVIGELKKTHPRLSLQLELGDMKQLSQWVLQNRIDLAVGVAPRENSSLELRPVFKDELLLVFSGSHRWAAQAQVDLQELKSEPLLLYQRGSASSQMVEETLRRLKIEPVTVMEVSNINAIKAMVALELGVAVLAPWTAEKELASGVLQMRSMGQRPLRRHWVIGHLPGRRLNLLEETFCRLCREFSAGLWLDRSQERTVTPGAAVA